MEGEAEATTLSLALSNWTTAAATAAGNPGLLYVQYSRNRNVEGAAFCWLVGCYSLLIVLGAAGNSLVVCAVVRKRAMRTARNLFIVNLAVSDLLLCLVTMPLTLMEILTKYWPLGREPVVCKMLGTLQATSIFVSTMSITAIALDRYHVIVYPTRESLKKVGAAAILSLIWLLSLVLASPMFVWRSLDQHELNLPGLQYVSYCVEKWPVAHGRAYYSAFSLVFQYLLPIITVTIAYSRICRKLRYRYVNPASMVSRCGSTPGTSAANGRGAGGGAGGAAGGGAGGGGGGLQYAASTRARKGKDDRRMRRTNALLYSIALIFCVSWLPLNIFNLVVDVWNPFSGSQAMLVTYAVCHMMGMSSACSNPLLYGWLNDNFRKEFLEIAAALCPCAPAAQAAVRERVGSLRSSLAGRGRRGGGSVAGGGGGGGEDAAERRASRRGARQLRPEDSRSCLDARGPTCDASPQPDTELTLLTRASTEGGF
ncbi:neuropeptide F receptor-like [Schistocerca gregaria]|uniref:neuropeptide F receptor-like n=1 Tax=Schistocerca gregaria TaxID=7010 RepID=UPI00211F2C02|nr:neuropeptide F receptor-like [Schistocerca gregaria]